jgi:hypothetical protein
VAVLAGDEEESSGGRKEGKREAATGEVGSHRSSAFTPRKKMNSDCINWGAWILIQRLRLLPEKNKTKIRRPYYSNSP